MSHMMSRESTYNEMGSYGGHKWIVADKNGAGATGEAVRQEEQDQLGEQYVSNTV